MLNLVEWVARRNKELAEYRKLPKHQRTGFAGRKRRPVISRGASTELFRLSQVSYKTVLKAALHGEPVLHEVAEKLSAATGGEVSVEIIRSGVPRGVIERLKRSA